MKTQELNLVLPLPCSAPPHINQLVQHYALLMIVLLNMLGAGMVRAHVFKELHSFGIPQLSGANPESLVQASDGFLYGTTGASQDVPYTIFRLNLANNQKTVLCIPEFPIRGLIEGPGGALYGIAHHDSDAHGSGSVFRMERDGSDFSLIATFTGVTNYYPIDLVTDGQALYGTTLGTADGRGSGTVFRLNADGSGYSMLRTFPAGPNTPIRLICEGNVISGLTYFGGRNNRGTVFRINTDGTDYRVIHNCDATTANPNLLMQGPDGRLYGTTLLTGTMFGMNPDGTGLTIVHRLGARVILCSLLSGANGSLYGATRNGGVFAIQPDGTGFTSLYEFPGSGNASSPTVLIQGADHALYGCTQQGGIDPASGVIFKLNTDGSGYRNLHEFQIAGGDGVGPSSLAEARDGQLYGTTARGGAHGYGSIFKQNRDGSGYSAIYHFDKAAGSSPNELVQGDDGALYGTTRDDGGTVFKVNTDGTGFRILHRFEAESDGTAPLGLIVAGGGLIYGITTEGGAHGQGIAFKINADGSDYVVLHSFAASLVSMPVLAADGALYGGASIRMDGLTYRSAIASLFRISRDGVFTVLATTHREPTVAKGVDDALYGYAAFVIPSTNDYFLTNSYYKLVPANDYTRIEWLGDDRSAFDAACVDGVVYYRNELLQSEPRGIPDRPLLNLKDIGSSNAVITQLVCGRDGVYYGTASGNGALDFGTVFSFELSPRISLGERRRELNHLVALASRASDREHLAQALRSLDAALDEACWIDDDHVAKRIGQRVFQQLKDTLRKLEAVRMDNRSPMSKDRITTVIERIAKASDTLSQLQNP